MTHSRLPQVSDLHSSTTCVPCTHGFVLRRPIKLHPWAREGFGEVIHNRDEDGDANGFRVFIVTEWIYNALYYRGRSCYGVNEICYI